MSMKVTSMLILLLIFNFTNSLGTTRSVLAGSPPSAPRNLSATVLANSIFLAWTAPASNGGSAITGYKIYRGTSANGEGSTPTITVGNITSIIDNSVGDGTTYFYTIKATNSAGDSPPSNEASSMVPVTGALPIMPLAGSLFIIILMLALFISRRRRASKSMNV